MDLRRGIFLAVLFRFLRELSENLGDDAKDLFLCLGAEAVFHVLKNNVEGCGASRANIEDHDEFSLTDLVRAELLHHGRQCCSIKGERFLAKRIGMSLKVLQHLCSRLV